MAPKPVLQFGTQKASQSPTPPAIKIAYRTLMVISGIWVLIEPEFHIPQHIAYSIARWTVISTNIIYFICQQFGYVRPDQEENEGGNIGAPNDERSVATVGQSGVGG